MGIFVKEEVKENTLFRALTFKVLFWSYWAISYL